MSFATEVKKELLGVELKDSSKKAFMMGLLQSISEVVISNNTFLLKASSFMPSIIRYVAPMIRSNYNLSIQTSYLDRKNINKKRIYCLETLDDSSNIIKELKLLSIDTLDLNDSLLNSKEKKAAYVIGSFIGKGSISDPRKSSYHLEIQFKRQDQASIVLKILKENYIDSKLINKGNQIVLYIKKSELISDTLRFLGAHSGVLQFEDLRIMRDLSNNVNRMMNCDISNGKKSLNCCNEQLNAIKYLRENDLIKNLTLRLQDAISLREEYPDASLQELSDYSENILGKHLSKSGISHCLNEVMAYYKRVK